MECTICLEPLKEKDIATVSVCGHQYHELCLKEWACRSNTCPTCRVEYLHYCNPLGKQVIIPQPMEPLVFEVSEEPEIPSFSDICQLCENRRVDRACLECFATFHETCLTLPNVMARQCPGCSSDVLVDIVNHQIRRRRPRQSVFTERMYQTTRQRPLVSRDVFGGPAVSDTVVETDHNVESSWDVLEQIRRGVEEIDIRVPQGETVKLKRSKRVVNQVREGACEFMRAEFNRRSGTSCEGVVAGTVATPLQSEPTARPKPVYQLTLQDKTHIQNIVRSLLQPYYARNEIDADHYTRINRHVSHKLYAYKQQAITIDYHTKAQGLIYKSVREFNVCPGGQV